MTEQLVLPDSFWTYIGFQLPATQVDELRIALKHSDQRYGYGGWYRAEWSVCSYIMERNDRSSLVRVLTDNTVDFVQFADDDKCVGICTLTGCITRVTNRHNEGFERTPTVDLRFVSDCGLVCWCSVTDQWYLKIGRSLMQSAAVNLMSIPPRRYWFDSSRLSSFLFFVSTGSTKSN